METVDLAVIVEPVQFTPPGEAYDTKRGSREMKGEQVSPDRELGNPTLRPRAP